MRYHFFDLGGTSIDHTPRRERLIKDFCIENNLKVDFNDLSAQIDKMPADKMHSIEFNEAIRRILNCNASLGEKLESYLRMNEAKYFTQAFPGVIDYWRRIQASEKIVAMITSGSRERVKAILDNSDLAGVLSERNIFCADGSGPRKPDPYVYNTALAFFGTEPHQVVAYEDTLRGVRAASAAGIRHIVGVACTPHHSVETLRSYGVHEIITSYIELSPRG